MQALISTFHKGDEVFLAKGSFEGTLGIFLDLRADPKWADILERNSQVRSYPVEWLEHAKLGNLKPVAQANPAFGRNGDNR